MERWGMGRGGRRGEAAVERGAGEGDGSAGCRSGWWWWWWGEGKGGRGRRKVGNRGRVRVCDSGIGYCEFVMGVFGVCLDVVLLDCTS